jgi:capsular exopolysaccharide synthesis family protein
MGNINCQRLKPCCHSTPMVPSQPDHARSSANAGWRRPRVESGGLQRYIETLRERRWLIVATTLTTTLIAILYLAVASDVYEADADLLVTPVSAGDSLLSGLGLIRESSDPTRDVETVAHLVTSRNVADIVRAQLNLSEDAEAVASNVKAEPIAQSNIVAITAQSDDPKRAQELANGFAEGVVEYRSAELRRQIEPLIERVRARIADGETGSSSAESGSLADQLDQLERLNVGGDPSIRVATAAVEPDSPVAPRPMVTLLAGIIGGLVLGIGGAFAVQAIDPRLRREDQLRQLFSLPILARIPRERHGSSPEGALRRRLGIGDSAAKTRKMQALSPFDLSPRTVEAYRMLRTVLDVETDGQREEGQPGRSILVTGPSPSEGKTTTAVSLAVSFALAGRSVILIESDFHRPSIAKVLDLPRSGGMNKVLMGELPLEKALVSTEAIGGSLRVLPAALSTSYALTELLSLPRARKLLEDATKLADYVVVDSPPFTEVVDAIPLARHVDDVLMVCRLGSTNLDQLGRLGDLMEQNEIQPRGFVVVGVGSSDDESHYMTSRREIASIRDGAAERGGANGARKQPANRQQQQANRQQRRRPASKR